MTSINLWLSVTYIYPTFDHFPTNSRERQGETGREKKRQGETERGKEGLGGGGVRETNRVVGAPREGI